jgi:hypothetical protein
MLRYGILTLLAIVSQHISIVKTNDEVTTVGSDPVEVENTWILEFGLDRYRGFATVQTNIKSVPLSESQSLMIDLILEEVQIFD